MSLANHSRKQLESRYYNDFHHVEGNAIVNHQSAASKLRRVKKAVEANLWKEEPLLPVHKINCAKLLEFYAKSKNKKAGDTRRYTRQIIEWELKYIGSCEQSEKFVEYILKNQKMSLANNGIRDIYKRFVAAEGRKVKKSILKLVQTDAEMEYTEALAMDRKFILHIGGTNSGKTYQSIERLKTAECGVYAGPLRLLALEIYDKLCDAGVPCSMITGEEQFYSENSRVVSCTAEMVSMDQKYDIAVIDEAQMISDPFRGHVWSRLIMGIRADEIHVCMAPEAERIVIGILEQCNSSYEIVRHERNTELIFEDKPFDIDTDIMKGDALILFSKRAVLDVAARLEMKKIRTSVIYGSLPPQIRKKQFEMFLAGETEVVVATDAIGLGVNLPIRRIVFMENMKFDGKEKRYLNEYEVRQIAGRAGRQGMYDVGYVTSTSLAATHHLKTKYKMKNYLNYARIGFPQMLLDVEGPIDAILTEWHNIKPTIDVYRKIDVQELIEKYRMLSVIRERIEKYEDKHELYALISCDLELRNQQCVKQWKEYCMEYNADVRMKFPEYDEVEGDTALERAETYYKMLDMYNHFSVRFGKHMDEERLREARLATEETILEELGKSKRHYIRRCRYCGRILPVDNFRTVCEQCYMAM